MKRKRIELEEDDYIEQLAAIIKRDYFPDIEISKARQNSRLLLLSAQNEKETKPIRNGKDYLKHWLRSVQPESDISKETVNHKSGEKPDTIVNEFKVKIEDEVNLDDSKEDSHVIKVQREGLELNNSNNDLNEDDVDLASVARAKPSIELQSTKGVLSLNQFNRKFTSEDNESFIAIVEAEKERRKAAHSWIWTNNRLIESPEMESRRIALLKESGQLVDVVGPASSEAKTLKEFDDKIVRKDAWADERIGQIDSWPYNPNQNTLLLCRVDNGYGSVSDKQDQQQQKLLLTNEMNNSNLERQFPSGSSTERKKKLLLDDYEKVSAANCRISRSFQKSLIRKEYKAKQDKTAALNQGRYINGPNNQQIKLGPDGLPMVGDYSMVAPHETLAVNKIVEGSQIHQSPTIFQIPKAKKRDLLHHSMVNQINKARRAATHVAQEIGTSYDNKDSPRFSTAPSTVGGSKSRLDTAAGLQSVRGTSIITSATNKTAKSSLSLAGRNLLSRLNKR